MRTSIPWNKGRLIGQKPPLKLKEIWGIRIRLQLARQVRDLALFNLAIDSKLRACDLVNLRLRDIDLNGKILTRATILQKKTYRPVQFELTEQTREAVNSWIKTQGLGSSDYLFPSRSHPGSHISTRQYARIVAVYPIVYLDCIHAKVRDGVVRVKAVYLALGVTMEGEKEVLGIWIAQTEGAKFWLQVVTELRNPGVKDILIACVDGLKGFPGGHVPSTPA